MQGKCKKIKAKLSQGKSARPIERLSQGKCKKLVKKLSQGTEHVKDTCKETITSKCKILVK
jgi:hypothetical protein